MSIKLIASDLDGTLLTNKKELSPKTVQVLNRAVKQGIHIVPCTGRPFTSVPDLIKDFPGVEYIITSNGGAVYSVSQGKRIYECLLKPESVDAALAFPLPERVMIEAFTEGNPYSEADYVKDATAYGVPEQGAEYIRRTRRPVQDIRSFTARNREKLDSISFVCGKREVRDRLWRELEEKIPDVYVTSSVVHLLEMGNKNGGKGNTLLWLLKHLGLTPEEAMAFGDADNDSSMLSAVKYGVAVGNATEGCKNAAAYVTDTNEEDGVAKAVERFI